jgi:hypothetical protein
MNSHASYSCSYCFYYKNMRCHNIYQLVNYLKNQEKRVEGGGGGNWPDGAATGSATLNDTKSQSYRLTTCARILSRTRTYHISIMLELRDKWIILSE